MTVLCISKAGANIPYRSPNTLRHTIISKMRRPGVPEAQIDFASGYARCDRKTLNLPFVAVK